MKVLMISSDDLVFKEGSDVRGRLVEYGGLCEELHIISLGTVKKEKDNISKNTFAYSTQSLFKWLSVWDGYGVAVKLLKADKDAQWVMTTQDPFLTGFLGWLLTLRLHIPWQIQIHTDVFSPFFVKHSVSNRIRVWLAEFLIPCADGLRVVSQRIKKSVIENCKLKIENSAVAILPIFSKLDKIINSPVKTDLHEKYGKDRFVILMPTRLNPEKNIEMAIDAVSRLIRANKRIVLLIVGSGPEEENLKFQVSSSKLQENVKFESWFDDLPSYYKTADLYLLTSFYEGGARAPLEALAAGLPVVMTDVAPANEEVKDGFNGRVVPVGDMEALAECLRELMENPEKLSILKKGALNFKAPRTHEEYLKIYGELLADLVKDLP